MKSFKISTFFVLATLPFFTSCASWNTATISNGLKNKNITYAQAREALENGADVKENWLGRCFLEEAAEQNRLDLIELFVEKGGVSCFEADTGKGKPFSLFMYAYEKQDSDLMHFCLKHPDKSKEVMRLQLIDVVGRILYDSSSNRYSNILGIIKESGVLTCNETEKEKLSREKAWREALVNWDSQGIVEGIATGADVNTRIDGHSLLYFAMKNEPGLVLALLDIGAKLLPEEEASLKEEAWQKALADWDEIEIMAGIETGADVNMRIDGHSLLYIAVKRGSELVSALRKAGARFTKEEATAMLKKIVREESDSSAGFTWKDLVYHGADVNAKIGVTSLLYVAMSKDLKFVSELKDAGAKLLPEEEKLLNEKRDKAWKEALASWNEREIVKGIKAGADTSILISDGEKSYSLLYWAEMRESEEIIALLKATGVKMSESEQKCLPVHRSARKLRLYCNNGEWGKIADGVKNGTLQLGTELKGENAFHWIASGEYCELSFFREKATMIDESFIVALKKSGVDINKKSGSKMTPLAIAIENVNANAVALFLRHGANPNDIVSIKGSFGDSGQKTLMRFAIDRHNTLVEAFRANAPYLVERQIREFKEYIRRAKEIVSLMSQATGSEVTDL